LILSERLQSLLECFSHVVLDGMKLIEFMKEEESKVPDGYKSIEIIEFLFGKLNAKKQTIINFSRPNYCYVPQNNTPI